MSKYEIESLIETMNNYDDLASKAKAKADAIRDTLKGEMLRLGAEEVRERPANAAAAECGVHADLLDVIIPACAVVRRGGAHDIFHDRKACDCAAAKRDDHIGIRAVEFFVDMLPQRLGKVRTENIRPPGGVQRAHFFAQFIDACKFFPHCAANDGLFHRFSRKCCF